MDWQDYSKCKDADSSIFFDSWRLKEALTYCNECSVREHCEYEGTHMRSVGVWGGTTDTDRRNKNGVNPVFINWV